MFAAAHEPGYGTSRNSGNDRFRAAIKVFADINSFDLSGRTSLVSFGTRDPALAGRGGPKTPPRQGAPGGEPECAHPGANHEVE